MKSNVLLTEYFPEIDLGVEDPDEKGYHWSNISIFDHWLTETEAANEKIITYKSSLSNGELRAYKEGENKFIKLYCSLAAGGVAVSYPGPPRVIDRCNDEIIDLFIDSLREIKFMDVYFPSYNVRIIGRYDRTDMVLSKNIENLNSLKKIALSFGLHILE